MLCFLAGAYISAVGIGIVFAGIGGAYLAMVRVWAWLNRAKLQAAIASDNERCRKIVAERFGGAERRRFQALGLLPSDQ